MPSWMRTLKTTGQRHAVGLRVCVGLALVAMVGGVLQAAPTKRSRKARGCVMTQDPTAMEQFVSFLRAYHQAVSGADRGFVAAHTVFPLPFASVSYDMEAKAKRRTLDSVDALLKEQETLLWPVVLVPKTVDELTQLRRGEQKCSDPQAPDVPDFAKGEPAFVVSGCEVSLTYLSNACESETHLVTLRFVRGETGWRLVDRSVRLGTK